MADVSIGRLAAITGVKVPTIRFYEQNGLIAPHAAPKDGSAVMTGTMYGGYISSAMPATWALAWRISANSCHCPSVLPCRAIPRQTSHATTCGRSRERSPG